MLRAVRRGVFVDHAFERVATALDDADRRLAQELAYGVLRLRGRLDHVIDRLVEGGGRRLKPDVRDVLRLGAYQLLELDRIPAYAAVSEAVEASKRAAGKGAASLTNAVLRRLGRGAYDRTTFPSAADDPLGFLASWGSHPRWLLERWLRRWPVDEVSQLVEHNNRRPAVYLSVQGSHEDAVRRLRTAGLRAEPMPDFPGSVRVESGELLQALELVPAIVQDPGAAAVVDYVASEPVVPIVDLCAAPGGKAALLAARGYEVWAFDISRARLARLADTRSRLGLSRLHMAVADSTQPPVRAADVVLIDAPCSGTGTLARNPDLRWRLRPAMLRELVKLQRRLLDAGAHLVGPGGRLVYATCSLEAEENEEQVMDFLARRPDFKLEPLAGLAVAPELLGARGELRVLPQRHGVDGAYAARLRRQSS